MAREPTTQLDGMHDEERREVWYGKWKRRLGHKLRKASNAPPSRWYRGLKIFVAVAPQIFVVGTAISLGVLWHDHDAGALALQYWLAICGTVQIAAGAFLGVSKFTFLRKLVNQEQSKATIFLRPVDNPRYLMEVLDVVDAFQSLPSSAKAKGLSAHLRAWAKLQEDGLKTKSGRLRLLHQEDLGILFMGASTNATYGTLMVVFSTIIALVRDSVK